MDDMLLGKRQRSFNDSGIDLREQFGVDHTDPMAFKLGLFGGGGGGGGGGSVNPNSTSSKQVKRAAKRQNIGSVSPMNQPGSQAAPQTADQAGVTYENTYTDLAGKERSYKTLDGKVIEGVKPTEFTDFSKYAAAVGSEEEAQKYFSMIPPAGNMLYNPDQQPQSVRPPEPFVGNVDRGAVPGTMSAPRRDVISGGGEGQRNAAMTEQGLPSRDFYVEKQNYEGPAGGAVGVGEQSFGRRSLIGGEAEVVAGTIDDGAVQTETPAVENQGDLAADPNYVPVTTDQSVVQDVNYVMPMIDEEGNQIAFDPTDPRARKFATGPMSSNLNTRRSGFGGQLFTR